VTSMLGIGVSATFPAITALAALAAKRGSFYRPFEADEMETAPPAAQASVVVTAVGPSAGEGLGLISPVR
jgi:hypothetical protein